jgi:hypothetical protein
MGIARLVPAPIIGTPGLPLNTGRTAPAGARMRVSCVTFASKDVSTAQTHPIDETRSTGLPEIADFVVDQRKKHNRAHGQLDLLQERVFELLDRRIQLIQDAARCFEIIGIGSVFKSRADLRDDRQADGSAGSLHPVSLFSDKVCVA